MGDPLHRRCSASKAYIGAGCDEDHESHIARLRQRAEFSAFVAIMMVLAIGILAKFDAAALLFYHGR
jgi:hypothetical protein